jgi:hypothetical protein
MDAMIETLKELRVAASRAYDSDAFPGSPRWHEANKAEEAVEEYEAAHPEVVAEINRRLVAARKARLAGLDIMGV